MSRRQKSYSIQAQAKRITPVILGLVLFALLFVTWRAPIEQELYTSSDQNPTISVDGVTKDEWLAGAPTYPSQSKTPNIRITPAPGDFEPHLFDIEGPFDGTALNKVCNNVQWREGVYFDCSNNSGGIGNMRNFILTCIRYAIEGGATLIMPTIRKRDPNNLEDLFTNYEPLDYMFDAQFFTESMKIYCPQMTIVPNRESVPNIQAARLFMELVPRDIGNHQDNDGSGLEINRWSGTFRDDLDYWLRSVTGDTPLSEKMLVILGFKWAVFFDWPIWLDGAAFANTFGRLLKIRPDVLALAGKVLQNLQANESSLSPPQHKGPLLEFVGVHLRVEADRLDWWPDEKQQIDAHVTRLRERPVLPRITYVATGSAAGLHHISARLTQEFESHVYSKESLLYGKDLEQLQSLQWDQQALVDYCVMLRSRYFLGMFQSSFSQNIAVRRHLLEAGQETTIWRGNHDKWSYLYGSRRRYYRDLLFFSGETMWP